MGGRWGSSIFVTSFVVYVAIVALFLSRAENAHDLKEMENVGVIFAENGARSV